MTYQECVLTYILEKYLRGETDEVTSARIRLGAEEIALEHWLVYVIEIAYHIGYNKSVLLLTTNESDYKRMKKLVKDNLIKRLSEMETEDEFYQ